jgi:hypothetical protein
VSDRYSPERRTALVLTGTGADGAYHAGVLRALNEAGVKIDLVCGRGVGAVGAVFASIDGAGRLWDARGAWRTAAVSSLYKWRWPIRALLVLGVLMIALLVSPLVLVSFAVIVYPAGLLLGMAGLTMGVELTQGYLAVIGAAFEPSAIPTWLPRAMALLILAAVAILVAERIMAWQRATLRRRSRGSPAWSLARAPLDGGRAARHFTAGVWDLLKGGASLKAPPPDELSRRFSELLSDNLAQPGFCELILCVHDLDARRDVIFGLVREPFRRTLFPPPATPGVRRAEAFDLAGLARDHVIDVLHAALSVPGLTEPVLMGFARDAFWRGEVHRLQDRPASLSRLLEEAAAAGAEQAIVVSASAEPPGPHDLGRPRLDPLGRASEHAASAEAAALRDAVRQLEHRFRGLYLVRPTHNPVGAFDLAGAYDERSDRHHGLAELMERGYEDAYRDFIEPVVAASGEDVGRVELG